MLKHYPVKKTRRSRPGAHHRRRPRRQRAADPAAKSPRVREARQLAGAAGLRLAAEARQRRAGGDGPRLQLGIGFVMIVVALLRREHPRRLTKERVPTYVIGEVREGEAGVEWM